MGERPHTAPGRPTRPGDRLVIVVAAIGIGFQVLHLAEHSGRPVTSC
ncbi:MAG: hypothetical protein AB1679_21390 [Actinomycetota bacterium]|jgi:hypothetical protein